MKSIRQNMNISTIHPLTVSAKGKEDRDFKVDCSGQHRMYEGNGMWPERWHFAQNLDRWIHWSIKSHTHIISYPPPTENIKWPILSLKNVSAFNQLIIICARERNNSKTIYFGIGIKHVKLLEVYLPSLF